MGRRAVRVVVVALASAVASGEAGAQAIPPCRGAATKPVTRERAWPAPLDALVTFRTRGASLRDALDRLGASSGVSLAYSSDLLPLDRPVCVEAEHRPLGGVLADLLAGTGVQARVVAHRVVLAPSVSARAVRPFTVGVLGRVIVTGNAVAASRRASTAAVEVIEGRELRLGGAGALADALGVYVPGVWLWNQAPGSLVAQYGGVRGASSFSTSYPKMYIDGVEVANPLLVTQIDPDLVDRVEVIRGPQGSALYGSDAISGVINVVTRHDGASTSGARVQVSSLAGASASRFDPGLIPTHEQRVAIRGGTTLGSAGLALDFGQTGAVFPSAQSRQITLAGDARRVTSTATLSGSARLFDRRAGIGDNPLLAAPTAPAPADAASVPRYGSGGMIGRAADGEGIGFATSAPLDDDQHVRLYTVGGSATIVTRGVWTHTLLAGIDGYRLDNVADATNPFDAGVDPSRRGASGSADRTTLRASSVAQLGGSGAIPATTLTLSAEHSMLRQRVSTLGVASATRLRRPQSVAESVSSSWNRNTGLLGQVSAAWHDALFVTGGLRVERNDAFSGDERFPVLPLLGAAYVRAFGPVELKLRSSYGKGIRPPPTTVRGAWGESMPPLRPRAGLDPEVQTGLESGIELYVGTRFSLQATRFDQRATGLIQNVAVAADTQSRAGTPQRRIRFQPENVGAITNRGWEMQAAVRHGSLDVRGTFTTVDSRVRAVAAGYLGDLRTGDRMLAIPARTASLSASWTGAAWSGTLSVTRAVDWINYDRVALARAYAGSDGTSHHTVTGWRLRDYWRAYDGDTHLRLYAARDVGRGLELIVVGDNLLGGQVGEPDNLTIRQGRTISGGLRASF